MCEGVDVLSEAVVKVTVFSLPIDVFTHENTFSVLFNDFFGETES